MDVSGGAAAGASVRRATLRRRIQPNPRDRLWHACCNIRRRMMRDFEPVYVSLLENGELERQVALTVVARHRLHRLDRARA